MPYISKARRDAIFGESITDYDHERKTAGELNYIITEVISDYVKGHGLSYQTINDIKGAMDSAKEEFRRRIVAPYEDLKIKENGDVYQPILHFLKKKRTKK